MVTGTQDVVGSHEAIPEEWMEILACDFLAGPEPAVRRMALHVWCADAVGIHWSALCHRTELTPTDWRLLMMRMGHALRRFQQEREMILSRPVVANSPLLSCFVDPDFATVAAHQMFVESMPDQSVDGAGRP